MDIYNLNTQAEIYNEDAYSEKELSLDNESSYSSDYENQIKEINNNINNDVLNKNKNISNNNNFIISKNLLDNNSEKKSEDKNMEL